MPAPPIAAVARTLQPLPCVPYTLPRYMAYHNAQPPSAWGFAYPVAAVLRTLYSRSPTCRAATPSTIEPLYSLPTNPLLATELHSYSYLGKNR